MNRYQLRKGRWAIQADYNDAGWLWLDHLRKVHPAFRRGRIAEVLQLKPSALETGIIYDRASGVLIGSPLDVLTQAKTLTVTEGALCHWMTRYLLRARGATE